MEGFVDFFKQLLSFYSTPTLETPQYTILRCGRVGPLGPRARGYGARGYRARDAERGLGRNWGIATRPAWPCRVLIGCSKPSECCGARVSHATVPSCVLGLSTVHTP